MGSADDFELREDISDHCTAHITHKVILIIIKNDWSHEEK